MNGRTEQEQQLGERVRRYLLGNLLTALGFAILVSWIDPAKGGVAWLELPIGLLGLASPVLAIRLFRNATHKFSSEDSFELRSAGLMQAFKRASTVGEVAAFLGVLGWTASHGWLCWSGVAMHVLMTGALWPANERIEALLAGEVDGPLG